MAENRKTINDELLEQEIERGRMGDRELAQKPGKTPGSRNDGDETLVWDDDQRQLIENQDGADAERTNNKPS
ncbi:hypothetical protein [Aestuariivirga sp.]|uniref:hypothetical protein n=1 Tax=Aestuariivirga sp. TaxID=2650926 RepID=UPI003BAD2657